MIRPLRPFRGSAGKSDPLQHAKEGRDLTAGGTFEHSVFPVFEDQGMLLQDPLDLACYGRCRVDDTYINAHDLLDHRLHKRIMCASQDKRINIRISSRDLQALKKRALAEGIPYQTLVASVLHKYVDDRLVDRESLAG